jgi:ATP-dependent DNA helicase PIF1
MERFLKMKKFYAVPIGRQPGIYETWEDTRLQTDGFQGAQFKSFLTREEAETYMTHIPIERTESVGPAGLTVEQKSAFDAVISGDSIFITGPGGTGKSFLLQTIYENYKESSGGKKISVTAMTGCAALLLGPWAKTLHSWAGIGLGRSLVEDVVKTILKDSRKKKRWTQTDCLVIDEVSMLTPTLLEYLDSVGRQIRKKPEQPFGGIQVVLVGDFYQLPPVSHDSEKIFAFQSPLWPTLIKKTVVLTEILRQKDPIFQQVLNECRIGCLTPESYSILEARKTMTWKRQEIKPTLLFTKNQDVSSINAHQLEKLPGEVHTFLAKTVCPRYLDQDAVKNIVDKIDRDAPYETELYLKERCQVMLLQQQYEEKEINGRTVKSPVQGLVNGSRGVVVGFDIDRNPRVKFMNGRCITIRPGKWSIDSEISEESISREQIPLRLAYALTIHKAQGASLDSALIDVGPSTFEYGQAYVALSRVRSLESLFIYEIAERAFRAHPLVKKFYQSHLDN